nr:MAG: hypothetical protein 3 [Leviviridae sp.]
MEVTVKRPTMLVQALLQQAARDLDLSVERDVATLRRRCEHEGLAFLTLTLPVLSDALERGLETGCFSCPSSFARHGRLPRFLGGFFKQVFTMDGALRDEAPADVIFYIRQICRFFKKPKMECSPARNRAAIQRFIDVDGELRVRTLSVERKDVVLDQVSGIIWSQVFPEIDPLDLISHHGPGATAERLRLNERRKISVWNTRSESTFPSDLHAFPNYGLASQNSGIRKDSLDEPGLAFLDLKDEHPVRVVFVPKTLTTPRVIAIEPSHMQFMQQSVKDYCYERLEKHRLTKRSIRFIRQDVNQRLAHDSSIDKRLATLDLSDASDRVHLHLVQRIFKTSGLLPYLEDARSLHAVLPDGRNVVLSKYASMGSALCFPVEAMVFYTLVQTAIHKAVGIRPTSSSIFHYSGMIDIYGDDIIVPVEYADVVVDYLESFALKVNVNKSFKEGNFRESCGGDFFLGEWVTPIYAREIPHDSPRDWTPETFMSWAAASDLFYMRGMWHMAQCIRDMVSSVAKRHIPRSTKHGAGLYFFSYLFSTNLQYNSSLHCWKQKRLEYIPLKRKDIIDGDEIACLNHWGQSIAFRSSDPIRNNSHLWGKLLRSDIRGSLCYTSGPDDTVSSVDWSVPGDVDFDGFCGLPGDTGPELHLEKGGVSSPCTPDCLERAETRIPWSDKDYLLVQARASDPHYFLTGREEGLSFLSSTKRGCFKSKSRWVNLLG